MTKPYYSNCLIFAIRIYLKLKSTGLIPELVYTHNHMKVYCFGLSQYFSLEFSPVKHSRLSPFWFALVHFFIPFKGREILHIYNYKEL